MKVRTSEKITKKRGESVKERERGLKKEDVGNEWKGMER